MCSGLDLKNNVLNSNGQISRSFCIKQEKSTKSLFQRTFVQCYQNKRIYFICNSHNMDYLLEGLSLVTKAVLFDTDGRMQEAVEYYDKAIVNLEQAAKGL